MEFRILGPLEVLDGAVPVRVDGPRQRALLAILLLRANEVVSTDRLIDELWGATPPAAARNALQASVSRLRRALQPVSRDDSDAAQVLTRAPGYVLRVDPQAVDSSRFECLAAEGRKVLAAGQPAKASALLSEALSLWHGPALAEFGYANFAQAEIDRLEELRLAATEERIEADLACGRHDEVLAELKALVVSHPFSERLRAHLMLALYRAGRQSEALQVYREGRELLVRDLGLEPGPQLEQTEAAILRNDPSLLIASRPTSHGAAPTNIASQATSFIGRAREIEQLERLLGDRRLVTLIGPGGSGKTRLALRVAADLSGGSSDGVWHVDLVGVPSARYLVHAIATTLRFPVDSYASDLDARSQLLDYLRGQSMLLVLDNFEHLIAGADLLVDILAQAPNMRILVTSRERLNLRDEWVFSVAGLGYAADDVVTVDPEALRLFSERARQVDPHLVISGEERAAALRVCALVEGMPLGLELAAAWASVLSCGEIVREIEKSLDFLTTTMRDVPDEHHSLRAVFDHTWDLLTADERTGLRKLTVFRGAFLRESALEVSGVDLPLLTDLIGKSIVHSEPSGRYRMHELIRRYAAEHLAEDPAEQEAVLQRHAAHHVRLLTAHDQDFIGALAIQAREEVRPSISDLKGAVLYAATRWQEDDALNALHSLLNFYRAQGLHEGISAFREITEALEDQGVDIDDGPAGRILVAAVANQAFCETICGIATAEERLRASLPVLRAEPALRRELGISLQCLGTDAEFRGEFRQADKYLSEALGILRDVADGSLVWPCLLWLGWTRLELGHYRRAAALFREAHGIAARTEDLHGTAYSLSKLGTVADALGSYPEAKRYHMAALENFMRLGDKAGPAYAISRMSLSAFAMGEYAEAERLGREGLERFAAVGHRWGIGTSYCRIGLAQVAQGKLDEAGTSLRSALQHALDHKLESVALYALIGAGSLLARQGQPGPAALALGFALHHPSLPAFYRPFAEHELTAVEARLSKDAETMVDMSRIGPGVAEVAVVVRDQLPL